ncbi:MAG TPA: DUF401 family protein, partial [Ignisphaera sp.]|nr:DUF401 family protein [Ignisphaera sp.]
PLLAITMTPAMLGLLPIAGGALLSAPIVDSIGGSLGLDGSKKLFVNVWYRHVIFLFYPLSTMLILASALGGVDLWILVVRQIPVALVMMGIGLIPMLNSKNRLSKVEELNEGIHKRKLFNTFTPLIISIALALILNPLDKLGLPLYRISMVIGISIGMVTFIVLNNVSKLVFIQVIKDRRVWELPLATYGAMLLRRAFLMLDLKSLSSILASSSIPIDIILIAIPSIIALATGVVSTGLVLSIPLLANLTPLTPASVSLIYVSSFLSYLGSPLHLCYVYTAQYLRIPLTKGYRYLAPSILVALAIAYLIYRLF